MRRAAILLAAPAALALAQFFPFPGPGTHGVGGGAAITYDNAAGVGGGTSSSATISNFTVGAGSDRLLVVVAGARDDSSQSDRNVSDITYGAAGLTKLVEQDNTSNLTNVEIWYLVAPASGTANVVVTYGGAVQRSAAAAVSFSNVHQTTPFENQNSGNLTNTATPGTSVNVTTTGAWLIDGIFSQEAAAAIEVDGAQVRRYRNSTTGPTYTIGVSTKASVSSGAQTTAWSGGASTNDWAWVVGVIKPL